MALIPADAARNHAEQHLIPGKHINNVYWCLNREGWSQPGNVSSKCKFLAYNSWYQDSPTDCEIDTDLRGVDQELLLRHFGLSSEHEILHLGGEGRRAREPGSQMEGESQLGRQEEMVHPITAGSPHSFGRPR